MKPFLTHANRWPTGHERLHVYLTVGDALAAGQRTAVSTALGNLTREAWIDVIPLDQLHITIQMVTGLWLEELRSGDLCRFDDALSSLAARTPTMGLRIEPPTLSENSMRCLCSATPSDLLTLRSEVTDAMLSAFGPGTDRYVGGEPHVTLGYANREMELTRAPVPLLDLDVVVVRSLAVVAGSHHPTRNWVTWRLLSRHELGATLSAQR